MKFIVPLKKPKNTVLHETELNFYKKHLTNNEYNYLISNYLERNVESYSSYMAMFQSKIVVGNASTLLREKLSTGEKILSCNLTPTNLWNFPIEGICSIKNCTYQEFEKRLLSIYSMSKKDYFSKLNKDKCYAMEYDEKISTIEILKRKIDLFLAENNLNSKYY